MKRILVSVILLTTACHSNPNGWTQTSFDVERYDYRIDGNRRAWVAEGHTDCTSFVWDIAADGQINERTLGSFLNCKAAKIATEKHFGTVATK